MSITHSNTHVVTKNDKQFVRISAGNGLVLSSILPMLMDCLCNHTAFSWGQDPNELSRYLSTCKCYLKSTYSKILQNYPGANVLANKICRLQLETFAETQNQCPLLVIIQVTLDNSGSHWKSMGRPEISRVTLIGMDIYNQRFTTMQDSQVLFLHIIRYIKRACDDNEIITHKRHTCRSLYP